VRAQACEIVSLDGELVKRNVWGVGRGCFPLGRGGGGKIFENWEGCDYGKLGEEDWQDRGGGAGMVAWMWWKGVREVEIGRD